MPRPMGRAYCPPLYVPVRRKSLLMSDVRIVPFLMASSSDISASPPAYWDTCR